MIKKTKNVAKALLVLWHKAKNIRVGISMLNYQGGGGETTFLIFLLCFFMLMINEIHSSGLRR